MVATGAACPLTHRSTEPPNCDIGVSHPACENLAMIKPFLLLTLTALCAACAHPVPSPKMQTDTLAARPAAAQLRIATYNTSLYSDEAGGLIRELQGDSAHARKIAAVLQLVRPDLVLLNEFDFDPEHRAADLFQQRYLQVAQPGGGEALRYPYRYLAPVNTGVPSGLDLDNNGSTGGEGRARCNDAWGYGLHPGQYGMLVLSRYPIDAQAVRSFQLLKWSALPGALRPIDPGSKTSYYSDAIWAQLRLSSKSHWDVPVRTPLGVVHALVSHPTPPVFDGAEKRNAARSDGGPEKTAEYAALGIAHSGDPHQVTGDFGPQAGTMRLDYVLPSRQFTLIGSGIFWPASSAPEAAIADGSDHHAVWVDVASN